MRKFYKNKKIIILILSLLYGLTFTGINASATENKGNEEIKEEQSNASPSPQNNAPTTETPKQTTISEQIQNMITQMGENNAELRKIIESLNSSSTPTQPKEGETGSDSPQTSSL